MSQQRNFSVSHSAFNETDSGGPDMQATLATLATAPATSFNLNSSEYFPTPKKSVSEHAVRQQRVCIFSLDSIHYMQPVGLCCYIVAGFRTRILSNPLFLNFPIGTNWLMHEEIKRKFRKLNSLHFTSRLGSCAFPPDRETASVVLS